ncbi:transposase [Orrella sp. 11846]|uniref:transposase n=1 Tax=Orrella sp. 11846 TaxID=3409913 RepID=UPI003B5BBD29
MSELRKRAQYTPEFKMECVRQTLSGGLSIARAADQLGIPNSTLSKWIRQHKLGEPGTRPEKANQVTAEQMEISRLRAEVAQLKVERDIAKKAAAYFSQDLLKSTPGYKK